MEYHSQDAEMTEYPFDLPPIRVLVFGTLANYNSMLFDKNKKNKKHMRYMGIKAYATYGYHPTDVFYFIREKNNVKS